ncbi:hypothetical protein DRE_01223 [Drechslerella stenobrocha 248]|uniref:Stress-response A/B barrel domain-containing protein n=1 Tax=Drechslerella stenobrocha 248 TaxID=1043628 RepID=W7HWD0_9PEZI|nr:hypothetical protein DRE_01223 [Drechslerella stenobrocha 248]
MAPIRRITLFKVPDEAHQDVILDQYKKLGQDASKDGKPYILSLSATKTKDDPRRKGFTLCAISVFASLDDMNYYDSECAAHQALKVVVGGKAEDVMTVFMEIVADGE